MIGHMSHIAWYGISMTGVMLALNRLIELKWPDHAEQLYGGWRTWLSLIPVFLYCFVGSTSIDLPSIYNSYYSVYLFQIDLREGAVPINNWFCFLNSCWVVVTLVTIYTIIMFELRERSREAAIYSKKAVSTLQMRVLLQTSLICFFLFMVALAYGLAGFVSVPLSLTKFATVALQLCSGRKEPSWKSHKILFQVSLAWSISLSTRPSAAEYGNCCLARALRSKATPW